MVTIFIVVIVLVLLGVGGYFVYQKFFSSSSQCANKGSDKSSNVSTFVWDSKSSSCVANVCMDGFGDAAKGGLPSKGVCNTFTGRTYDTVGTTGKCTDGKNTLTATSAPKASTNADCANACDGAGTCVGYDWDGKSVCDLYSGTKPTGSDGTANFTCFAPK